MITDSPFLKLHVEEFGGEPDCRTEVLENVPQLDRFIDSFTEATGWELDIHPSSTQSGFTIQKPTIENRVPPQLQLKIVDMSKQVGPGESCVRRDKCDLIIDSMNHILKDLFRTRIAVSKLSAELSTSIPVTCHENDGEQLLLKLESVIRQGIQALGACAGAVYLLDDATKELNLRVQHGLGTESFLTPPRTLKDSVADLEALVGKVVAIDNAENFLHWNLPETFPSGICVPVSTQSTPLGTMWFFSESVRQYSTSDKNIAELVAGRVSAELERESAVRSSATSHKFRRDFDRARLWQQMQVPAIIPRIDGWKITGNEIIAGGIGGSFFDTSVSPSGQILGSVGDVQGAMLESSLAASSLRAATRAHESSRFSPDKFMFHVNNTMWNCPLGDQIGSLFHIQIEPQTGIASWSNAGQTGAFILGVGAEPFIAEEGSPLGACEDEEFESRDRVILPNSMLFAFNEGLRNLFKHTFKKFDDLEIMELLTSEGLDSAAAIQDLISKMIEDYDSYRTAPDISFLAIERLTQNSLDKTSSIPDS